MTHIPCKNAQFSWIKLEIETFPCFSAINISDAIKIRRNNNNNNNISYLCSQLRNILFCFTSKYFWDERSEVQKN